MLKLQRVGKDVRVKEHGLYIVDRCNQVLLFGGRGPWNDETMRRGAREFDFHISNMQVGAPWAQFSCLFGESIMPPSTFSHFVKHTKIRKSRGLSTLAIIIKDSDIKATIKNQLSDAYEQAAIEHAFFEDFDEARNWLKQRNFKLPEDKMNAFIRRCDSDMSPRI